MKIYKLKKIKLKKYLFFFSNSNFQEEKTLREEEERLNHLK
jgi:hypothetical protein